MDQIQSEQVLGWEATKPIDLRKTVSEEVLGPAAMKLIEFEERHSGISGKKFFDRKREKLA